MSTSSFVSSEVPPDVPRRMSRRIWLFLILGLAVVAVGIVAIDGRIRSMKVAQSAERLRLVSLQQGNSPSYVNQPVNPNLSYAQSTQQGTVLLDGRAQTLQAYPQNRQPVATYYANPSQPVDPAEIAANNEINQLKNQLRSASGEQKQTLRKSLTDAVGKLFDLRHATQAKQVEKLEAELAEAKELHKKRGERKDEIVERRIAELLQSADDLAWNREIVNSPSPTSNYPAPSSYIQPTVPYGVYTLPPSNDPYYNPNATQRPAPSQPLSSTPPQFIPLNSSESGQNSLLRTEPATNDANEFPNPTYPSQAPSGNAPGRTGPSISTTDANASEFPKPSNSINPTSPGTTSGAEPVISNPMTANATSKDVIESAYAYVEALEVAIDTKKLVAKGIISTQGSSSKRNAAKTKAIWEGVCSDLAQQMKLLESELSGKMDLRVQNSTPEKRAERQLNIERLNAELQSLAKTHTWVEDFKRQSIDALEKQFEQDDEKKADAAKYESPSESTSGLNTVPN